SHGALQVLGTPEYSVVFRSFRDDSVGGNDDGPSPGAAKADWGGMVFRDDSDYESRGIFLNYVNHADIQHGGGKLFGTNTAYAPIHMVTARPTISHNYIHGNADSAMSANPNSFDDEIPGNRNPQLMRIGPDVHDNLLADNTINGLFVRIATVAGDPGRPLDILQVSARFDDTDITHVIKENLHIAGNPGGALYDASAGKVVARESGRLAIDPGVVVKLGNARIELERGSSHLIAEGSPGHSVVFTSVLDDRFGAGGTIDSLNDGVSQPQKGNWGGLFFSHTTRGSIDYALVAYAGGETAIEGSYAHFAPVEIQQANVRVTNSTFESNADGAEGSPRNGRLDNAGSTIFVRGAQPIIVKNVFRNNDGPVLDINVNALNAQSVQDAGRSTGLANRFADFDDNYGPLVRLNRMDQSSTNGINGMVIRGGDLTTESIWDDTDIVHVLYDEIVVGAFNHDTYSGLRLESGAGESLVVKLSGDDAGFTATGERLDIQDRIGGALHVVGQPGFPVILTSINDCSAGAGLTPDGRPQIETIPGTCGTIITTDSAPYADIVVVIDESSSMGPQQLFTTTMIPQLDAALIAAGIGDGTQGINQYGLVGFNAAGGAHDGGHAHLLNGSLWGTSDEYVVAAGTLVQQIGLLDGYEGLDFALANYNFRTDAAKFVILITDTDRERIRSSSTFDSLLAQFRGGDVILETIVDAEFKDGAGSLALALDYEGNAYIADGSGSYVVTGGGYVSDWNVGGGFGGGGFGGGGPDGTLDEYINLGFATQGFSGDINQIEVGGLVTESFSKAIADSIVVQAGNEATGTAGDWRGIELLQYSNDRNVGVLNEVEPTFTGGQDLNGSLTTAQPLGVLASGDRDDAGNPDNDETGGSENFRLGFEVLGTISPDDPADRDLYSFDAKAGDRIWIDLDRTGSALDSVVELLDVTGNVLASSNDSWNETGTANELEQNVFLDGDWYTLNHYDAGFSVVLPGTVGETTRYLVRVRSNSAELNNSVATNVQFHHNPGLADTITLASGNFVTDHGFAPGMSLQIIGSDSNDGFYLIAGVSGSTITLAMGEELVSESAQVGTTLYGNPSSGQYQLQVRMRQIDEEPGSTIRYADIRFATTGILVEGLPYRSNLTGEAAETENNNGFGSADILGNLLESDRVVSSVAGNLSSAGDVDWYTFNVDLQQIQSIAGVSASNSSAWPFVFDLDYADGLVRTNSTVAVYRQVADQVQLVYVGRESNVEDDRATIQQQDLLDNG
ncbi:MAG: pre-peptidase C-terminal domain-containing protein, partial [Planctomycetes bacterium]|nr:pre-peptidase C-terminal domain-containing protein [Planctomycetota bacterium]